MLGIIGAMDVEVRTIKDKMTGTVTTRAAGCDFVTGELEGVMITVVQCAPGKVMPPCAPSCSLTVSKWIGSSISA